MWKRLIVLAVLIVIVLMPLPALAAVTADVTITATGIVVGAPGGFTVAYISDYEVGLSWTKPEGAVNTMIRAKYGSYPASPTDGYLVYYGDLEYTSDTAVSLDETATAVYYRAWSEKEPGVWSPLYAEGNIEGVGVTLLAFIILALGMMIAAFVIKRKVLAFASTGTWMVLAAYSYNRVVTEWDIYYALFFLCGGLALVSAFEPFIMRERKEEGEEEPELDEEDKAFKEEADAMRKEREQWSSLFGNRRRRPTRKLSRYEKTGEH